MNASMMLRCTLVRTTIEIPERLLRQAKAEAALRGLRLKDIVRDALESHLAGDGRLPEPAGVSSLDGQELSAGCVFPLVTGATGPALRRLRGGHAQRLLDEDDVDRVVHSR